MSEVDVTFKSDFGSHGATLGSYDEETEEMNINLSGILISSMYDFYGCPRVPEEYEQPDEFENFLIKKTVNVITHEYIHKALMKVEGAKVSLAYDKLPHLKHTGFHLDAFLHFFFSNVKEKE
jgi:hypothetical protein